MPSQPNILLICSDQHNVRTLGCNGNDIIATPNLDRLAAEGVQFDAAYCNCPLCLPSRSSFLTGRQPFHCETLGNEHILDSRFPTFANLLAGAGYHTILVGRMHFFGPDQHHGFVERLVGEMSPSAFFGLGWGSRFKPLPGELGHMEKPDPLLAVGAGRTSPMAYDRAITDAACGWLTEYAALSAPPPFLMTVGLFSPHCPFIAPPELYAKYQGRVSVRPITAAEVDAMPPVHRDYLKRIGVVEIPPGNLAKAAAAYYGLVEYTDGLVGQILDALERTGLLENTIVVYFSDHGEMLGEHGRWHKGCFYEASVRVPLLVRPAGAEGGAGRSVADPVSLVDLLPTLADWGGAEIPFVPDGRSLVPLLRGESPGPQPVLSEYYDPWRGASRMVRLGPWKLSYYAADDFCELFNLADDPDESTNLADEPRLAAKREELKALLFSDGWHRGVEEDLEAKMRTLGFRKARERFVKGMAHNPLIRDIPGYWREIESCENTLVEDS